MPPSPNNCFSDFPRGGAAADGRWVQRSPHTRAPYRLNASLWGRLGTSITQRTPQHYGKCDDVALLESRPRPLYDWEPHTCSLEPFDTEGVCKLLGRDTSILFVGDSTVAQLFLSFVSLLNGRFGINAKRASVLSEITASACSDGTRLNFVRSDLLLWSHAAEDFRSVRACDGYTTLNPFVVRASRDADILVLGLGHHFPSSLEMVQVAGR